MAYFQTCQSRQHDVMMDERLEKHIKKEIEQIRSNGGRTDNLTEIGSYLQLNLFGGRNHRLKLSPSSQSTESYADSIFSS